MLSRKFLRKSVKFISNHCEVFHSRGYSSNTKIQLLPILFNSSTTAHQVVKTLKCDVSGKVGLVTGSLLFNSFFLICLLLLNLFTSFFLNINK